MAGRRAHWRHIASSAEHPEAFFCHAHQRSCRKVWVREYEAQERLWETPADPHRDDAPFLPSPSPDDEQGRVPQLDLFSSSVKTAKKPPRTALGRFLHKLTFRMGFHNKC